MEDTAITNSGKRLDLSAATAATMSKDGFTMSASTHYTYHTLPSSFFLVQHLFDQSLEKSATQAYKTANNTSGASIEILLNQTLFINNVRVYPASNGSYTTFKVSAACIFCFSFWYLYNSTTDVVYVCSSADGIPEHIYFHRWRYMTGTSVLLIVLMVTVWICLF